MQKRMDRLEIFHDLMGILDRWTEEAPERYGGSFKNLRRGVGVRELIVTPNCSVSVPMLKTYFATEVLNIYRWNTRSKVSWKDIQRSLAGKTEKKYRFDFTELDKCCSPGENQKAAEKTQLLSECFWSEADGRTFMEIPVYLLMRLQELFRKKLGQYWRICDMESDRPEIRRETYKECLLMLSLHEIFTREYARKCSRLMEEARQRNIRFHETFDQMTEIGRRFGQAAQNERSVLAGQIRDRTKESMEYIRWIEAFFIHQLLCLENNIALEAEIQLAMLLELKKLDQMRGDSRKSLWLKAEAYLECMKDKYTDDYVDFNRNKVRFYKQLETNVQEIFLKFMNTIPLPEKNEISDSIKDYLTITEQKEPINEEQRKRLWLAQCRMVRPLMANQIKSDPW